MSTGCHHTDITCWPTHLLEVEEPDFEEGDEHMKTSQNNEEKDLTFH